MHEYDSISHGSTIATQKSENSTATNSNPLNKDDIQSSATSDLLLLTIHIDRPQENSAIEM